MDAKSIPFAGPTIDSPLAHPFVVNHRPGSWPPADDWPVMVDQPGQTISRWGDSIWILDLWAKKRMVLNFGDGKVEKTAPIDKANADLLRRVVGWWLYGAGAVQAAGTLLNRFSLLRPIFALCSAAGILASDLTKFPMVAEKIPGLLALSQSEATLSLLHGLFAARQKLGFTILDEIGLTHLAAALPGHLRKQTPYIPPRIWRYQLSRLKECLDDFLAHKEQLDDCFRFCLDAYLANYGNLAVAGNGKRDRHLRPFQSPGMDSVDKADCKFHGPFKETAERFGIYELLGKWTGSLPPDQQPIHVDSLSAYFTLVSYVGLAYILNFSLMRRDEAVTLGADCLSIERDELFGAIYLIRGATSKTMKDHDAIWVTSPTVQLAVTVLRAIGDLRKLCASMPPDRSPLYWRPNEPWAAGSRVLNEQMSARMKTYSFLVESSPKLFDVEELRITARDLDLARLVTPTLPDSFAVGSVWPLGWHQLRRTGAVNMQASGLVSDASLQFQLKHLSRVMSLYYAQNHAQVRLEESAQYLYIQTMYEVLGRELQQLASDRFLSPHGAKRKNEIVRLISVDDLKTSVRLAKKGGVACREIILGACTSNAPCSYGGVDSIARCGGGDTGKACADVLYDRSKWSQVAQLEKVLDGRLETAPHGSPLRASLEAQKRSVENYYRATRHG